MISVCRFMWNPNLQKIIQSWIRSGGVMKTEDLLLCPNWIHIVTCIRQRIPEEELFILWITSPVQQRPLIISPWHRAPDTSKFGEEFQPPQQVEICHNETKSRDDGTTVSVNDTIISALWICLRQQRPSAPSRQDVLCLTYLTRSSSRLRLAVFTNVKTFRDMIVIVECFLASFSLHIPQATFIPHITVWTFSTIEISSVTE